MKDVSLSLIGGAQPGPFLSLTRKFQARCDGFDYRVLLFKSSCQVASYKTKREFAEKLKESGTSIMDILKIAIERAVEFHALPRVYTLSEEAAEYFMNYDDDYT